MAQAACSLRNALCIVLEVTTFQSIRCRSNQWCSTFALSMLRDLDMLDVVVVQFGG
jgi:hypothetical protein